MLLPCNDHCVLCLQQSAIEMDIIEIDPDTKDMLKLLDMHNIAGLQVTQPIVNTGYRAPRT